MDFFCCCIFFYCCLYHDSSDSVQWGWVRAADSLFGMRKVSLWLFQLPDHHHHHHYCPGGMSPLPWIVPSLSRALVTHRGALHSVKPTFLSLLLFGSQQGHSQNWGFQTLALVWLLFCCHVCTVSKSIIHNVRASGEVQSIFYGAETMLAGS